MFQPDQYMASLIDLLKRRFGYRLAYVGLQGSYLRGEATEQSDIDVMVVIVDMTIADMDAYRKIIAGLEGYEKSCGFICGLKELLHWNPLEICHLLHTTRDCFGTLAELVPAYTEGDVRTFVKLSLGNMYHELCHRYIHRPMEQNADALGNYRSNGGTLYTLMKYCNKKQVQSDIDRRRNCQVIKRMHAVSQCP
jgi:predicted nucleotidyltransferase